MQRKREHERGKTDVLRNRCDHCPRPPLSKAGCCCDRTRLRETDGQCYSCLHALHRFPTVAFPDKGVLVEAVIVIVQSRF